MKYLIINGDDYGYTPSVSAGIRYVHNKGFLTTTSAFMNTPYVLDQLDIANNECQQLGLGVHLNLTMGVPLSLPHKIKSIVNSEGEFYSRKELLKVLDKIVSQHVEAEWRAQIELFLSRGYKLDHVDSHHNISYIREDLFKLMVDLAVEYKFFIRCPTPDLKNIHQVSSIQKKAGILSPDRTIISFFKEGVSLNNIAHILKGLPNGVSELVCHPGHIDEELINDTKYSYIREKELEILLDKSVKKIINSRQIKLAKYQDVLTIH